MTKYRMYVDESGNSDLNPMGNSNERFLALTGVIIDLEHVRDTVHPEMELVKVKYFDSHPNDPVVLHRSDIMNRRGVFQSLYAPRVNDAFNKEMLRLLRKWEYVVVTVCLDKKSHLDRYGTWSRDPYHYCMEILLERFCFLMYQRHSTGDVMAESRGGKEDRRLKDEFRKLWESGADYLEAKRIQRLLTSRELKVKPKSANIAGLQLADLIANPCRSEILSERGLLGRELGAFAKEIAMILGEKYYRRGGQLYGKKFL